MCTEGQTECVIEGERGRGREQAELVLPIDDDRYGRMRMAKIGIGRAWRFRGRRNHQSHPSREVPTHCFVSTTGIRVRDQVSSASLWLRIVL